MLYIPNPNSIKFILLLLLNKNTSLKTGGIRLLILENY